MQTNYNIGPIPGQAGQLFDNERSNQDIVTGIALVAIPFGVVCEFVKASPDDGKLYVQPLADTGTTTTFLPDYAGISVLDTSAVEQGYTPYSVPPSTAGSTATGYPVGSAVPVLRRGRIWAAWDGTGTPKLIGSAKVWHSSDGTHSQGVITFTATATTAGAEIDALGSQFEVFDPRALGGSYTGSFGDVQNIVPMSVNLPGKA